MLERCTRWNGGVWVDIPSLGMRLPKRALTVTLVHPKHMDKFVNPRGLNHDGA